ncbi:MAG: hydroxyethylthiazole kinase [Rhizobiaceae bacterium]
MVKNLPDIDGNKIADCVARFRSTRPHVHCITNSVAQHFTANVLLAAGATPSMTIAAEEITDFVTMADALLINLGTMDSERIGAVDLAVAAAQRAGKPWALDPVFVQASPIRLALAQKLLAATPSLVRCNRGEYDALYPDAAKPADTTTIALTGREDVVTNGGGTIHIANGSPLMDRITAMGCALTGLAIGFLAVEEDHLLATSSALAFFALAGEQAEARSEGPGTFVPHFLDALSNLTADDISKGCNLS